MERKQFLEDVAVQPWWFAQRDIENNTILIEKRTKLGQCWNWTADQWYADPLNLEVLYRFLTETRSDLMTALDEAGDDVYKRGAWLDMVITAKGPPAAKEAQPAPSADKAGEVAGARVGPAASAPAKKPSPFARAKPAGDEEAQPATQTEIAATGTATSTGTAAQPAKKSIFKKQAAPTEPAAPQAATQAAETSTAVPPTREELTETLSSFAADPDVPISEEEAQAALRDPDFAAKLTAAEAELEAQLEAELASAEAEE